MTALIRAVTGRPDKISGMSNVTPVDVAIVVIELLPALAFGLAIERVQRVISGWPRFCRVAMPALLVLPYATIAISSHIFRWRWLE